MYGVRLLVTRAGRVPYIARGRELYADGHRTATQESMDALPSEVKLLVVENTVSVADLRDLRSSSQSWGAVVDLGIRHWLRVQPMGTTMQPFLPADQEFALRILGSCRAAGSSAEVHEEGALVVSITCDVGTRGSVQWWLTRESGRVPRCKDTADCRRCSSRAGGEGILPKAYVVVKCWPPFGERSVTRLARFQRKKVVFLARRILPLALKGFTLSGESLEGGYTRAVRAWEAADRMLRAMALGGLIAASESCECCVCKTIVCRACEPPNWDSDDTG
jgi:hypothetical protein